MTPTDSPNDELLDRYLAGDVLPSERVTVEQWLAERPELAELVAMLGAVELGRVAPPIVSERNAAGHRDGEIETVWRSVAERAGIAGGVAATPYPRLAAGHSMVNAQGNPMRRWLAGGALLAAVAVATVAVVVGADWRRPAPASVAVYATGNAQRRAVTLEDGSTITLGTGSTARVTESKDGREVDLTGEGVFDVAPHAGRAFVVRAGGTVTRVLGTAFGVRAYQGDSDVRVAVFSGRVQLNDGEALDAGDVARVTGRGREVVVHEEQASVERYRSWTRGELTFTDTPISTVAGDLSRWYDVDIRIATPALANDHFSASFRGASLEYVLHTLSVTLGARVERHGRMVIVRRP